MHSFPFFEQYEPSRDRRSFIRRMATGSAGLAFSAGLTPTVARGIDIIPGRSRVSFTTGWDRRETVFQALEPFRNEIAEQIRDKQVIVKANLVDPRRPVSATHVDATRAVLDFLAPIYDRKIWVGDSNGRPGGTAACFEVYDYYPLEKEYNIKLVDLNDNPTHVRWVMDNRMHPLDIEIIDQFADPDNFIISLTRPKTHGNVIVTLSVKNIVMGSPVNVLKRKGRLVRGQKTKMHAGGNKGLNFNLFSLSRDIRPDLSIIDGREGMQGNGPTEGTPVDHGFALAGFDMLAVDSIATTLMGFDFDDIGYLNYIGWAKQGNADLANIDILGPDPANHIIAYDPPDNIERLLEWKEALVVDQD